MITVLSRISRVAMGLVVPMPILHEWGLMIRLPLLLINDDNKWLCDMVKPEFEVRGIGSLVLVI